MSEPEASKKKLPRDAAHFIEIEDKLKEIEAILREMRLSMSTAGMETVDLTTGTLIHLLGLSKDNALALKGKFDSQYSAFVRAHAQKQTRDRLKKSSAK